MFNGACKYTRIFILEIHDHQQNFSFIPDWRLFPNELKIRVKKHRNPSNASMNNLNPNQKQSSN